MAGAIRNFGDQTVWLCAVDGPLMAREADALDLIAETYGTAADWIAIPSERLSADFLRLRTGVAGAILQKLVNYRFRIAIVGDLSRQIAESQALSDYVTESNRGKQIWFVRDAAELERRLAAA